MSKFALLCVCLINEIAHFWLTHPPCLSIQLDRWLFINEVSHPWRLFTTSCCCLRISCRVRRPDMANRAKILPQFRPPMSAVVNVAANSRNCASSITPAKSSEYFRISNPWFCINSLYPFSIVATVSWKSGCLSWKSTQVPSPLE